MEGLSCPGSARWFVRGDIDENRGRWQWGVQSDSWDWGVVHMVWGSGRCGEQRPVVVVLGGRRMCRADGSAGVYEFDCYRRRGCVG